MNNFVKGQNIPTGLAFEITGGQIWLKITWFSHFWPLDGVEITRKRSFRTNFGPILGGLPGLGWGSMIHRWNCILRGYKNMEEKPGIPRVPDALEPKYCQKWPVFG